MKEIPEQKGIMRGLGYKQPCVPKYVTGPSPGFAGPLAMGTRVLKWQLLAL